MLNRIFSTDSAKAIKADKFGYLNAIHYLAPATMAGVGNVCSHYSDACYAACLGKTSGQAGIVHNLTSNRPQGNSTRQSRLDKTRRFMRDRKAYMADVVKAIEAEQRKANRHGKQLCVRMNGSSDIAWEGIRCVRDGIEYRSVYEAFSGIQFVDYTKNPYRFDRKLPANLHLTFSRSETNEAKALELLRRGVNVAVVFGKGKKEPLPTSWQGFTAIDGDLHDLRHLDPKADTYMYRHGYVVGLSPKGRKAKKDQSSFVVRA